MSYRYRSKPEILRFYPIPFHFSFKVPLIMTISPVFFINKKCESHFSRETTNKSFQNQKLGSYTLDEITLVRITF